MSLRHFLWRLREEFWPEKHPYGLLTGCDTSGMVHHFRLSRDATDYQPVDPDVFRATLAHINEDLSRFTFVDVGCGKGRALLLAEEYAFRKIVGVDASRKFVRIASRNAARIGSHRITVIRADARAFDFPSGPVVVFMYNPFSAEIMRSVMQRLISHPDTFYIAYVNPLHAESISSLPGAAIVAQDDWCAIWRFSQSGSTSTAKIGSSTTSAGPLHG